MTSLSKAIWPDSALTEAMATLAWNQGWLEAPLPNGPVLRSDDSAMATLGETASELGLEAIPVALNQGDLKACFGALEQAAPALLRLNHKDSQGLLVLCRVDPGHLVALTPEGSLARFPSTTVGRALGWSPVPTTNAILNAWLREISAAPKHLQELRARLEQATSPRPARPDCWLLRPDPGTRATRLLKSSRVTAMGAVFMVAATSSLLCTAIAWGLLGSFTLRSAIAPGLFHAWLLLVCVAATLQLLGAWCSGRVGITFSVLLRQRLLSGGLRSDPNWLRARGFGGSLGLAAEAEALERVGLEGGIATAASCLQLLGAALAMLLGAAPFLQLAVLVGFALAIAWQCNTCFKLSLGVSRLRLALTSLFVENLRGHHTRKCAPKPQSIHGRDDRLLATYVTAQQKAGRSVDWLDVALSRGWLALGLLSVSPALLLEQDITLMGISIAGVLQGRQGFSGLRVGIHSLLRAAVAWRVCAPLLGSADLASRGHRNTWQSRSVPASRQPLASAIVMQDLTFCHGEGTVAVLEGCNLRVEDGDHCLLTGPSGSGKSTLAMLLAGLHRPSAGHLSIYGVRWQEASDWAWSRLVTSAPQFHENRILNASLAFNLLMGRRWPPEPEDLQAAFETCDALGLGELVRRMPNGLQQTVGESGWQLSHGECSRIYLARALLQETPVVVLDETFGALDDDALRQCIEVARKKTRTLFVIAHP